MSNCGVGFAPVRASDHGRLVELIEGVEDIPGAALHEGLKWSWNSFPEYLDALDERSFDIDVAAQVPHGALPLHVMGERGAARENARPPMTSPRWPNSRRKVSKPAASASLPRAARPQALRG